MAKEFTKDYFEKKICGDYLERRKRSIERNKKHNEYVCLIANSFYGPHSELIKKVGFKTFFLEPLFDIESYLAGNQSKNFDLLLHNATKKISLFVEVKTSFVSIKKLLEEFEEAKNVVKEKFNSQLAEKMGLKYEEHNSVEFVLVIPREQSQPVKEEIQTKGIEEIIVWDIPTITKQPLEIKHDIYNLSVMKAKRQTHHDDSLRQQVYEGIILANPLKLFNFILNSDPHQKLIYFLPLIRAFDIKEFNFLEVKNRIFNSENSFDAYCSSEKSKEFMFKEIIRNLQKMDYLNVVDVTGNVLTDRFSLKFDSRVTEVILKRRVSSAFFENYLKEKEPEIKKEAENRFNEHHGQRTMDDDFPSPVTLNK